MNSQRLLCSQNKMRNVRIKPSGIQNYFIILFGTALKRNLIIMVKNTSQHNEFLILNILLRIKTAQN